MSEQLLAISQLKILYSALFQYFFIHLKQKKTLWFKIRFNEMEQMLINIPTLQHTQPKRVCCRV